MADEITPPAGDEAAQAAAAEAAAEQASAAEDAEWANAENEIFPGLHKTNDDETTTTTTTEALDVETDTTTTTTTQAPSEDETTTTTTTVDPAETPEQKTAREAAEAAASSEEAEEPDTSARDARIAARESQQQVDAVAADVREKIAIYKNAPKTLVDSDGDPVTSIADVMNLVNPATITAENPKGRGFTEEEAGFWLLREQQKFNEAHAAQDKEIERIAEVNVDLKDQADAITYKYGELLKGDEALRKRIWAQWDKTTTKDPESGIITNAPVNMEEYYDVALAPYLAAGETAAKEAADKAAADKVAADAEEARKRQERADRTDVFGGGNTDDLTDDEDKEWGKAMEAVYGPPKK